MDVGRVVVVGPELIGRGSVEAVEAYTAGILITARVEAVLRVRVVVGARLEPEIGGLRELDRGRRSVCCPARPIARCAAVRPLGRCIGVLTLSPYDFWQYFRNTEDADVGKFLKIFTRLPLAEIAKLEALGGAELNEAKKILATEVTAIVHGRAAADEAAETARKTFEEGALSDNLPSIDIARAELEAGIGLLALVVRAGLAASNGEARRHVQGGAVRVNDQPVSDERRAITLQDLSPENVVKLSLGKKKHILVKPV